MVGVAGGGVGSASGPIRKAGGGGGGAVGLWPDTKSGGSCRFLAQTKSGGGGGGGAVGFWPTTKSGGWGAVGFSGPIRRAGGV